MKDDVASLPLGADPEFLPRGERPIDADEGRIPRKFAEKALLRPPAQRKQGGDALDERRLTPEIAAFRTGETKFVPREKIFVSDERPLLGGEQ